MRRRPVLWWAMAGAATFGIGLLAVPMATCQNRTSVSPAGQQQIEALDDALKSGLLTQQDYEAKVAQIRRDAAAAKKAVLPAAR